MNPDTWQAIGKVLAFIGPTALPFLVAWIFKPHLRQWVLDVLNTNRPNIRQILDEEFTLSEICDKVTYLEGAVIAHGKRIGDVEAATQHIPHYTEIVQRLATAIEGITKEIGGMQVLVGRMDERQRLAWPEIEQRTGMRRRQSDE